MLCIRGYLKIIIQQKGVVFLLNRGILLAQADYIR